MHVLAMKFCNFPERKMISIYNLEANRSLRPYGSIFPGQFDITWKVDWVGPNNFLQPAVNK